MSKFWFWFIPFILIISVIIYMLIIRINNNMELNTKLEINELLDKPKLITKVNDRKIYSIYDSNKYGHLSLKEAFDKRFVTVDKIVNNMNFVDALNDGGTNIYYSEEVANVPIYLIECNNLSGNNNIYILNEMNIDYCRS